MKFENRITEMLGVEIPIVQAPMGWIARAQLASAVSNAGGLGIIETSSGELDAIREEIREIEEGRMDRANNPLKNAPHTVEDLVVEWGDRPYSREQGCFPPGAFRVDKYWPPVNRVDNVHGDRNLICTCPPLEDYAEAAE